jgi:hypothetical protein
LVWGVAPPNGSALQWQSQWPHGADTVDLGAGYPLMESTVSWQGSVVTAQAMVDGFADGQVQLKTQAMTLPTIKIGSGYPLLRNIVLGDTTWLTATSNLHPATASGSPGLQATVRVTGWTCNPPGPKQSESIQLTTSSIGVQGVGR